MRGCFAVEIVDTDVLKFLILYPLTIEQVHGPDNSSYRSPLNKMSISLRRQRISTAIFFVLSSQLIFSETSEVSPARSLRPTPAEILDFLKENLPPADRAFPYLAKSADEAYKSLEFLAGLQLPTPSVERFLNDVSPYAVLTEPREDWRADFRRRIGALVSSKILASSHIAQAGPLRPVIDAVAANLYTAFLDKTHNKAVRFIAAKPNEVNNYALSDILNGTHTGGVSGSRYGFLNFSGR